MWGIYAGGFIVIELVMIGVLASQIVAKLDKINATMLDTVLRLETTISLISATALAMQARANGEHAQDPGKPINNKAPFDFSRWRQRDGFRESD